MTIEELIISEINKKGKIDISQFIEFCQYGKDGYYIKKNPIGINNDFITAPEVSQMFGEILGLFIINCWEKKIKTKFNLIELGPGKGTLIYDILRTANINKNFVKATYLTLIEKNDQLINLQKDSLHNFNFNKVNWSQEFNIEKNDFPSIIYSNEFFDCFPIRQFHKKHKWYEKFIQYNLSESVFNFVSEKVVNNNLIKVLEKYDDVKIAEISFSRIKYFDKICKFIKKNKGIFITIDYGYKDPPNHFSLQTIYNHKKTHLFENIGDQDITTHVNFDELINIARKNNLKIELFCSQKDFLISCGIKKRRDKLQINKNEKTIKNLDLEYDRLTNKSEMGETFKVLVVSWF